jgi:hypothetical protein
MHRISQDSSTVPKSHCEFKKYWVSRFIPQGREGGDRVQLRAPGIKTLLVQDPSSETENWYIGRVHT